MALRCRCRMPRMSWTRILAIISVWAALSAVVFLTDNPYDSLYHLANTRQPTPDMRNVLHDMFKDKIVDLSAESFVTPHGPEFEMPEHTNHWEPLGKKVLIIDVDTRLATWWGDILNKGRIWRRLMKYRTAGILNHFAFTLIHGYDYRLIRAPDYPDRHGSWTKVPMMRQALLTHDIVIFMDADAILISPELPMEWLMSRWNVTDQHLLTMAVDPKSKKNSDSKDMVLWNTGFMIAHSNEETLNMFERWERCPTDIEYPQCSNWTKKWAHEQYAFGNFIRYDYDLEEDFRIIPCGEANGMPGHHGGPHCNGDLIRHFWKEKETAVDELYKIYDEETIQNLHKYFVEHLDEYYVDMGRQAYPLSEDLEI